jgi:hypothetical protein
MDPAIMTIQEMIEGCGRDEGAAWAELWCLVDDVARPFLRRLLQSCRAHRTLVDDAMQEFFLYLRAQNLRRLLVFRGTTKEEFQAFLRKMAGRFFMELVKSWRRAQQREADALQHITPADRAGPTEAQLEAVLGGAGVPRGGEGPGKVARYSELARFAGRHRVRGGACSAKALRPHPATLATRTPDRVLHQTRLTGPGG